MSTKSTRVGELEEAIAQAVAALDDADGSRIGLQEGFDSAREILKEAYGVGFEKAVSDAAENEHDQDGDEDDEPDSE